PDVSLIHYPDFSGPLLSAKRMVITLHDLSFFRYPHVFPPSLRVWKRIMARFSVWKAQLVICVSRFTANEAAAILKTRQEKLRVIPLGVKELNRPFLRKVAEGEKPDTPYLLYVGTLEPRKNLIRLVKATALLWEQGLKYPLIMAGRKGWLYQGLFDLIDSLGLGDHVRFLGHVSQDGLSSLYRNAEVFVYPSVYEGFGLPPLEAMSCGTPVVVSNRSSLPEVCGDAACYVDPFDEGDMARGILSVLQDDNLRRILVEKGFERVKLFSWENAARETIRVYEEVAGT
ncbi:MAG: glycosyltransferase family 4 protein, partial [Deltaproteobacteria bacterium]|nr:glycosyltransferase family 4 protein [Deltaproteobacteria bacterium]